MGGLRELSACTAKSNRTKPKPVTRSSSQLPLQLLQPLKYPAFFAASPDKMRFGKKLRNSVYPKWNGQYMDYAKLKGMLRENEEDDSRWTENDENKFCDEILNVQLEKVAAFQQETFKSLEQRANSCADKLKDLVPEDGKAKGDITTGRFKEIETELDEIINETKELKKYSNINYTAFLKIVKKHDRKRGNNYKIRPMMLMSLSKRQFNTESGYSPLLNKLSIMYYAVRQQLDESEAAPATSASEAQSEIQNGERYTAYKFWVHPDNLLEVKTYILRRLPVLVYSEQSAKDLDNQGDPTLNSLYFDNPEFSLYNQKVDRQVDASSLRIRWFGQFKSGPEFVIEKKMIHENGTSEERKFAIKEKYIQAFTNVNKGEISRFPYSILEIKVKEEVAKKHPQWVEDLMASHLVHKAPRFSKFVHGVASLFEDNVNNLPFWLSELETDIRRDPQAAFEEEEERKAKRRENEQVVGSLLGATPKASSSFKAAVSSPLGKSYMAERMAAEERASKRSDFSSGSKSHNGDGIGEEGGDEEGESSNAGAYGTMSSIFPSFSLSRYAQSRRERNVILPPGVTKPKQLIKDSGPLQVEPKVWLANERTFLKWQHICVLLGVLAVSLYNTAGQNKIAEIFGFIYLAIAIFAGIWGTAMHRVRRNMIVERSGKDFDNMIGPMVVSFALMMSLILNFYFQYHAAMERLNDPVHGNVTFISTEPLKTEVKIELL